MSKQQSPFSFTQILQLLCGIAICTAAQVYFLIPNKILPSGLTGIGTLLYYSFGTPVGMFTFILGNVILIGLQARFIGLKSTGITVFAIIFQGVLLDLCLSVYKVKTLATDPMLASIYGGLLTGFGISLIFRGRGTLGGSDIIAKLLLKFRHIPAGTTLLWTDVLIIGCGGLVFGPDLALFAIIKSFIASKTLDSFMEGFAVNRQVMIVSPQADTIAWGIIEELHRGVTLLQGRGGYSSAPTEVVLTAVRRNEVLRLEEIVYGIDSKAFLIISDARRIVGRGFVDLGEILDEQS